MALQSGIDSAIPDDTLDKRDAFTSSKRPRLRNLQRQDNMKNPKQILLAFSLVLAAAPSARAEDVKAGDLLITQAWSRATPSGAKVAGGYLTIENKGQAADRLVGISGEIAGRIEIHEMAMDDGVMKMRQLEKGLTIEPGKTVKLAPGGNHVMMLDLKAPLKQGDKVPLTLDFEKAGKVKLSLDVQAVGAPAPGGGGHMDKPGDHSGMKK